jgi:hypothetical protein
MTTTQSGRPDGPGSPVQPEPGSSGADAPATSGGPSLGRRLKIRSMVHMAGEVLPFFWPMRNFIHHNPLHGLEHLPFEQAVAEASQLFHARGYLKRVDYQQLMQRGSIQPEVIDALVAEFVTRWLAQQDDADDPELAQLLQPCLVAIMTRMNQPKPGDDVPCAEEVLAGMRRSE